MVFLDKMTAGFLEAGDVLKINNQFYPLLKSISHKVGFTLICSDEWGEHVEFYVDDDSLIDVYVEEWQG